ncbi:MAG: radical SAM/SPASM domain-containing protein [Candidatus Sericytochromatia bacterium]
MSAWQIHPASVLRAEAQGALWFHRQSAETLELDLAGLELLGKRLQGHTTWRGWTDWNYLRARGFVRRTHQSDARSVAQVQQCIAEARTLQPPLRSRRAPEVLHVSLTDACQQRCSGCFFSQRSSATPRQWMEASRFRQICDEAADAQVFQLALGGGEPLLHPELPALVAYGVSRGLVVNLTTSGSLLTPERLRALQTAGLGQLQLSLNGATPEVHAQTRPAYTAVRLAMERCREAGQRWGLNVLVTPHNLEGLEDLLTLAAREKAFSVNLLRPKPAPDQPEWLAQNLPDASANRQLQQLLRRWQRRAPFQLMTDTSLSFLREGSPRRWAQGGVSGCSAGRRMLTVQVDGRMSPCSHVPLYDEGLAGAVSKTSVAGSLLQVWRESAHLERFRRLEETLTGQCASCALKAQCRGCRAVVWALDGDFSGEDRQCPRHQSILS